MSARSAQRTRWRRWRMGRDIAGGKDREGRMGGCEAQIVESIPSRALEVGFFFFFFSHPSHFDASKCFPPCCFLYFPFPRPA